MVRQFPSHVFRESSLVFIIILSIFSSYVQPGNGLHPPQCQWSLYQDIERLNCLVDSGNSLIVEEEVHGIGPEHAKSLWVQCNSDSANVNIDSNDYSSSALGTEGVQPSSSSNANAGGFVISQGIFMAVPNLRDLRLENCKISGITPGALSYLPYLHNLTIRARAHTSLTTWPSSSLEIQSGVLRSIPQLRHLDLSTTSLSSLPNDFLCFLPNLNYANFSNCGLRDFLSIGIVATDPTKEPCENEIKVLDVSNNNLLLLPPAVFAALSRVEELRCDSNSITSVSERAFLGMKSAKIISCSNNFISSLPPLLFHDTQQIQEIYLNNNSLSVLAPGLFAGLKQLVVLDLSHNQLTSEWVTGETYRGLDNLYSLNLGYNQLTKISDQFRDLRYLQMLNLEHNAIFYIATDAFAGMPNIYNIVLSYNHIISIDSFICNNLHAMAYLSLDNNKIETVEPDSFKNCSSLSDLNLSSNKLKSIPGALQNLKGLKTIDLGENLITDISNASYQGLQNLYGLRLTGNAIKLLPRDAFSQMNALKIINCAKNNITYAEPGVFDNNPNLQAIRLDSNQITNIDRLFNNIEQLLWLNISNNQIGSELNYNSFNPKLQWLDIANNKLTSLGNCMDMQLRIRNLDVSNNFITDIGSNNIPDSIEILILKNNKLSTLQPYTFYQKRNISRIDISSCALQRIDQNALRISSETKAAIFLGYNPLQCDCSMLWLKEVNDENSGYYPIIQDVADVKCTLAFDRQNEKVSYLDIKSSEFLCKYESQICFKTCHCCDFDACDCSMKCPANCSCYHNMEFSRNVVDCAEKSLMEIPNRISMDVTDLHLDGNVLGNLDSHAFIGRKHLRSLYLNDSQIEYIQNRTFTGLKALTALYLQNNLIERIEGYEFAELDHLELLRLDQNRISYISQNAFAGLPLRVLYLHSNNLIKIWDVSATIGPLGHTLVDITLRNEWSCDCQFFTQFKNWISENRAIISDAEQIQCVDQVTSSSASVGQNRSQTELVVIRLLDNNRSPCSSSSSSTDLSVEPTKNTAANEFNIAEYVWWLVCVGVVILVLFVLFIITYRWRKSLQLLIFTRLNIRLTCKKSMESQDKLFDGFCVHSHKDEAWVRQVLAGELERNDPPYRLCLMYRDLPTGSNYLADTIVQASEASRRTMLVLSHHFLKDNWNRTDIKAAVHSILKADRHRKVIIILLGDLPTKELDPDLRASLSGSATVLSANEKQFWSKLKFAMPDVKVKVPAFRGVQGVNGRTSSRTNNSQHHSSGPLQCNQHFHSQHHNHAQPSPNLSQAHHLTYLGPQNNISSPLIGPPLPLTAPPQLLANLPPNIPNGTLGPAGHHHGAIGMGGPVTTVIGGPGIGNSPMNSNNSNSGSQRAPQRHPSIVNSAHNPNNRQNNAIHI
ncbi:Protein toll [Orchesella cincta]|uniref:Protein toll n=1 Tax=Orchesella cincta TaxID=48709 RepID=A0A1D2ND83_ORCCI|nr:Protein toll [Orchesella cincta]